MDNGASSYRRFRDNGDERGLDAIIMEYKDGLMLYLTSIVGNIQTAEELTEDTFVLLGTKKPRFNGDSAFRTWLYAIGRHLALDWRRRHLRLRTVPLEEQASLADAEAAIEAAYRKKEQQIHLHRAMRRLNRDYQQVLWLIYFEDMSAKEAAAVMRKSVRSVESMLYRARKSLRSQLESEGFDYEEFG